MAEIAAPIVNRCVVIITFLPLIWLKDSISTGWQASRQEIVIFDTNRPLLNHTVRAPVSCDRVPVIAFLGILFSAIAAVGSAGGLSSLIDGAIEAGFDFADFIATVAILDVVVVALFEEVDCPISTGLPTSPEATIARFYKAIPVAPISIVPVCIVTLFSLVKLEYAISASLRSTHRS